MTTYDISEIQKPQSLQPIVKRIHTAIRTGKPTQPYKRDRSAWMRGGEE